MVATTGSKAKAKKVKVPRAKTIAPPPAVKWRVDVEFQTPDGKSGTVARWEAVFDDDGEAVLFTSPDDAERYALRLSAQDSTMWLRVVPHGVEFKTFTAYNFGQRYRQHALTGVRLRDQLVLTAARDDAPEEAYYVVEHRTIVSNPAQTQDVWRLATSQRYQDVLDAQDAAKRLSVEREATHEFRASLNDHAALRPIVYRQGRVALDVASLLTLITEVATQAEIDMLADLLLRSTRGVQTPKSE